MTETYMITDHATGTTTAVGRYEISDTLKSLNPGAPAEVLQVCKDLEAKLRRGDYYGEEEEYLNVTVTIFRY